MQATASTEHSASTHHSAQATRSRDTGWYSIVGCNLTQLYTARADHGRTVPCVYGPYGYAHATAAYCTAGLTECAQILLRYLHITHHAAAGPVTCDNDPIYVNLHPVCRLLGRDYGVGSQTAHRCTGHPHRFDLCGFETPRIKLSIIIHVGITVRVSYSTKRVVTDAVR